jgi:hypothetical protein
MMSRKGILKGTDVRTPLVQYVELLNTLKVSGNEESQVK